MAFRPYLHVERFGNEEVLGIELGKVYVFPKLDGTNSSLWHTDIIEFKPQICAGSRNRELTLENDNAGFYNYIWQGETKHCEFLIKNSNLRLYGEWLVPHTLKTYREDAWRKFWIFDVYNDETEQYLSYDVYKPLLDEFGLDYIPPLQIIKNGSYENFVHVLNQNNFFIKDGEGIGEGIVLKNYDYYNKYGRQTWAKIITTEFKEQHHREMGAPEKNSKLVEEEIVDKYCTEALITKVQTKIQNEMGGWSSKYIPRLLETVYYDLIKEETWEIIKEFNNPRIDFKILKHFVISKTKTTLKELF